jgi:hypothetical protein
MEGYEYGSCTKRYMDTITTYTKKSLKIVEFCNQYRVRRNLINEYYLRFNENIVLMWVLIIVLIIACVTFTKRLLDLFLAKFVISIKKRHDLSPLFVGSVFLTLSYQLKDIFLLSASPKVEPFDLYYTYAKNISCYFHYLCIPFSFLLLKDAITEKLPRGFVNTSLAFIFTILLSTVLVGYFARINYVIGAYYVGLGVLYFILVALMIPKYNRRRLAEREKWQRVDQFTRQVAEVDRQINEVVFRDEVNLKDIKKKTKEIEKQHKSVIYRIMKQIWDPELTFLDNCIQSPIIVASLFTTPYPKNPMMKTILRYPIVGFGIYFTMNTTFYSGVYWVEVAVTLVTLLTYVLMERFSDKKNVKTFIELISIVQAQSILILITGLIGDAIFFIPFSLSMNRTSVNSFWSSIRIVYPRVMYGYIFLKNNEFMVLAVSYFSCWIFQMTFMFGKAVIGNTSNGNHIFDLFGTQDKFINMGFGLGHNTQRYLAFQVIMVLALFIAQLYYFNTTRGAPDKNFARSMLVVWSVAMGYSLWFGLSQSS